ncbi:MAG: hypothetical protein ABW189_07695 [Rickettsiales bacterium]
MLFPDRHDNHEEGQCDKDCDANYIDGLSHCATDENLLAALTPNAQKLLKDLEGKINPKLSISVAWNANVPEKPGNAPATMTSHDAWLGLDGITDKKAKSVKSEYDMWLNRKEWRGEDSGDKDDQEDLTDYIVLCYPVGTVSGVSLLNEKNPMVHEDTTFAFYHPAVQRYMANTGMSPPSLTDKNAAISLFDPDAPPLDVYMSMLVHLRPITENKEEEDEIATFEWNSNAYSLRRKNYGSVCLHFGKAPPQL